MKVVLFDIDGTLLSSGGAGKAAMEAGLAAAFGLGHVHDDTPYSGRTDRAIMGDLLRRHGLPVTEDNRTRLVAAYLERLPDCLARHQGRVLPGILALLDHLGARADVAVGLLTGNLRVGAERKLGHYQLWRHFAFGGFGDRHLERDDVAREALEVIRGLHADRVRPEDVWVIGDTPLDVGCARAIGARVAAVATGWHGAEELAACRPDLLFRDLTDPSPLLAYLA